MSESHRLKEWFAEADEDIQKSYAENHAKARDPSRVQQTGHAAEHAWGELLREWLPPQYEVAYRRYVLPEVNSDGYTPTETDLVVLRPGYPSALRGKEEVLAAGVALAFSVKLRLNSGGLAEAAAAAAQARRHTAPRYGSLRSEATGPFRYGILGHAHDFGANPRVNLANGYWRNDAQFSKHPRESIDLICVADLGVWGKGTLTYMPKPDQEALARGEFVARGYSVQTSLTDAETALSPLHPGQHEGLPRTELSPLAVLISTIYSFLAQEDEVAEPFFRGLLGSEVALTGGGHARHWEPSEVYHQSTLDSIPLRHVGGWDRGWGSHY